MRFYNAYSPKVDINQFVFDKIYSSYEDLQKDVSNSDILPGRYVLIRYSTEVIQSAYPETTDNKNFDGNVALNTEAAEDLRKDITNYNTTVWRKTHSNSYELIAQLEPSQAIANLLNTEKGKALIKEAISEVITTTVTDTTSIGNSYTIPQYEKNNDGTLTYKGGIPIFNDVTLVLNGVLE